MNQDNQIKAGDIVILKSGGPNMTVQEIDSRIAKCYFYNESKAIFEDHLFPPIVLKIAD